MDKEKLNESLEKMGEFLDKYLTDEGKQFLLHQAGTKANPLGPLVIKKPAETLLNECCEALGWQGGTIHQIKEILRKAKKVKLAYLTMRMPQSDMEDEEIFKAAMTELIYVFQKQ